MQVAVMYTYRSILGGFRPATLECDPMTLVLETLGSNETLDAWCLGVRFRALFLRLDLATDDEFADLQRQNFVSIHIILRT